MSKYFKLILAYVIYFTFIVALVFLFLSSENNFGKNNNFHNNENIIANDVLVEKLNKKISDDKKYVILTFDDGWSSQYEAFKKIKPLKGTLYICSAFIGQKDRLTLENLNEMYNNGWDICNHTVHHSNLTKVTIKKANDEIYGCSSWIAGQGFKRNNAYKHFAYPEGAYNDDIIQILKKQNILTARTTNPGNDTSDFLQLGRTSLHGMTKKNIRDYILSDQKFIIFCFHRIISDNTKDIKEIDLKESYFKVVIDTIRESKREVLTLTEWYNNITN